MKGHATASPEAHPSGSLVPKGVRSINRQTTSQSADPELILAVRSGNQSATGALYGLYRIDALTFARTLTRDAHDAEDVFHESFTRTITAIGNGAGPSENFLTYLYAAIRNTAAEWWKRQRREMPGEAEELDRGPAEDTRLQGILEECDSQRILSAFKTLPERWQKALWYADVLNEPPRRAAPMMGIAPNAFSALFYARKGLRTAYLTSPDTTGLSGPPAND